MPSEPQFFLKCLVRLFSGFEMPSHSIGSRTLWCVCVCKNGKVPHFLKNDKVEDFMKTAKSQTPFIEAANFGNSDPVLK